ncbi:MAG: hybrid sensor histidine kinase/response regulator [Paucimonas sp.]|nr:hybrid sensor histidine kinase/response regulator [Paucimonas sp.]
MERRILIHAPVGRDALLASKVLEGAGLECFVCMSVAETLRELDHGAGALFIVEEMLSAGALKPLAQYVADQPNWSDLPILVLTNHGVDSPNLHGVVEMLGNVTLLERPVRAASLISSARSALRGRIRQYQMRETDRLKDEFLASLGHELRNPLAPIRTAMQVLNRSFPASANIGNVTQVVERQVAHLTRLVDDLLDVARVTSGKITLQRKPVALAEVVAHAIEICAPLLEAGGHRINQAQPAQTVMLDADPARLVQSLSNVLANAIKFTPQPSTIDFTVELDGDDVIFRIKDKGIGLEADALPRIFDMFAQSDPVRGQVLGGLGIGLSLTRRFIEMHGGTVSASSPGIGQGCEFVFRLPIVMRSAARMALPVLAGATSPAAEEHFVVLVVDDNRDGADMLQMMLELDGHTVLKAYDGREAVDMAQHARPDVVFMDIGLPDMDGYEATRRIRQQPGSEVTVIIALTGWGHDDVRRRAAASGMDHHLVKPVNLEVLRAELGRISPRAKRVAAA